MFYFAFIDGSTLAGQVTLYRYVNSLSQGFQCRKNQGHFFGNKEDSYLIVKWVSQGRINFYPLKIICSFAYFFLLYNRLLNRLTYTMQQKNDTIPSLFDQLYLLLQRERCYDDFRRICEQIEAFIRDRYDREADPVSKNKYRHATSALSHTIGKEVVYIENYQGKMHKKNAPKIRTEEYFKAIDKAHSQVHIDILEVMKI